MLVINQGRHTFIHTRPALDLLLKVIRPLPPMSIQLSMMQPKHRFGRRNIHITPGIPPDTKVPADMQRGHRIRLALQAILELPNRSITRDLCNEILRTQEILGEEVGHVAAQAARIIPEAVRAGVVFDAEFGVHGGHQGAEVNGEVGEGAFGYAAAARAAGELLAWAELGAGVGADGIAVAAHAIFVAVEDGRVHEIRVLGPVPVGLVACVGAFGAESGLVRPDVVAVPVHEVGGRMDGGRHVHVDDDEVIVAGFGAGVLAGGELAGLLEDTFDGSDVLLPFILGQVTTVASQ